MIVGILALQGGIEEHIKALETLGVQTRKVRVPQDMDGLEGIVIPGGESTVLDKLARAFDVAEPLANLIRNGLPVFATCAGLIYVAKHLDNPARGQQTLELLDVVVRRNAFGTQRESFDTTVDVSFDGATFPGVQASFIRAPIVTAFGPTVEAIAALNGGEVVGVRQGNIIALSFHPEETGDYRIHQAWLDLVRKHAELAI
ncbi:pyridoxal 5'-phosphate synthase glutaminase subunit PdxT [Corynebacterium glutamicum]|uniref:pyridoxal 5'-phosphate synthase glutaminase subunit PdxT n=1 Tax=Corynebacterium glutamicum TaxID=1718 RepID=UPI001180B603|nr:pyridoxal 5'-phosphate synthase glutaminase subunit PdxT [Corynebacterium glutamicum]QDQ20340.1 pyridoxal 5'-phosphate synthase glutaminase subunit PdxT [Corynebacterium glutamicum]QDQ23906.1 pyridoxal 5'-phosphate synthase glutaminase subunit PdxT [Corynebacterium glutamicum]